MIVSVGKKVIKQLTSIEYSLVFSRPYDGQVHVLSLERVFMASPPAGVVKLMLL
jgi:hypothetical protein